MTLNNIEDHVGLDHL